ncbi:MAG: hypothetical protein GX241_00840 [Ruminococcaceae bacterium]|nr:hypothetical protein [Oscillospiraceae bacterium]
MFGNINYYDECGRKVGRSEPGFFVGYVNYDSKGNKIGRSEPGFFGSYNYYDNHDKKVGHSDLDLFGNYQHRDTKGNKVGSTYPSMFDDPYEKRNRSQCCYVATCVYGSYDCPQVWTLRRFRDDVLGRAFIRFYYVISPIIVKFFDKTKWFNIL